MVATKDMVEGGKFERQWPRHPVVGGHALVEDGELLRLGKVGMDSQGGDTNE